MCRGCDEGVQRAHRGHTKGHRMVARYTEGSHGVVWRGPMEWLLVAQRVHRGI